MKVHRITSAQSALSDDLPGRQKRYFISMMIRTLCFILTVVTPSPFRWFFLLGAVTLPYIAVIIANAGRETVTGNTSYFNANAKEIASGSEGPN